MKEREAAKRHAALQPRLPAISVGPHRRERVRAREAARCRSLRSLKTTNSILRRLGNHLINEINAHDSEQAEAELSTRSSLSSHSLLSLPVPSTPDMLFVLLLSQVFSQECQHKPVVATTRCRLQLESH